MASDSFLFIEDCDLSDRPADTLDRVLAFLGLEPHDWGDDFPRVLAGRYPDTADTGTLGSLAPLRYQNDRIAVFELP